jgi:hypothetical protein
MQDAIRQFEVALTIDPQHTIAHMELGRAYCTVGDFQRGWEEFAWFCHPHDLKARYFEQPLWDGSPLDGRIILLWMGHALGENVQFVRYVSAVNALDATVIVECHPRLVDLVQRMPGVAAAIMRGAPLPQFDVHAPFQWLPVLFERRRQPPPTAAPYLSVDVGLVQHWRERLQPNGHLTVGLSWSGTLGHIAASQRFTSLRTFAPLSYLRDVRFVSLQMGPQALELLAPPTGLQVEYLQDDSCSVADTAALMESLDLIISVDTMVAHLAGALGRPVWTLLPHIADWRWMEGVDRSPWYPTMRLFRQPSPGDWTALIKTVRQALAEHTRATPAAR